MTSASFTMRGQNGVHMAAPTFVVEEDEHHPLAPKSRLKR